LVRNGSNITVYIDGVSKLSITSSGVIYQATNTFHIGEGMTGYMSGIRYIKQALATSTFTPPTTPVTTSAIGWSGAGAVANQLSVPVSLLYNFTDAAVADQDASNVLETLADAREVNFGPLMSNYSVYFDGSGDYLTVSNNAGLAFGTGDFTLEFWAYVPTSEQSNLLPILDNDYNSAGGISFCIRKSDNLFSLGPQVSGQGLNYCGFAANFALDSWNHFVLVAHSSVYKAFLNGTQLSTQFGSTVVQNVSRSSGNIEIGRLMQQTSFDFGGYISNLRVIKGTALYTSAFTPPTTALSAVPGTVLLTCQNNRFRDTSSNNLTVTRNGDAKVTDFSPFGAQVATPPSVYFDGTGDYAKLQSIPTMNLGTANFTIEAWVYPTSSASGQHVFTISADSYSTNSDWGVGLDLGSLGVSAFIYNGNTGYSISASSVLTLNAWNHIAWTRANGTGYAYVNAVQVGTASQNVAPNYNASWSAKIGYAVSNYPRHFYGYISDLRVTPGQVLYGGFEPPTQAFPTR
jgi:hypothetical protein